MLKKSLIAIGAALLLLPQIPSYASIVNVEIQKATGFCNEKTAMESQKVEYYSVPEYYEEIQSFKDSKEVLINSNTVTEAEYNKTLHSLENNYKDLKAGKIKISKPVYKDVVDENGMDALGGVSSVSDDPSEKTVSIER